MTQPTRTFPLLLGLCFLASVCNLSSQPTRYYDLAALSAEKGDFTRIHGATGNGAFGVPVGGPADVDGDGLPDFAISFLTASPLGRNFAGEVDLVLGSGKIGEVIDTAINQKRVLRIFGSAANEVSGAEVWIDDVTGDGLGDLLIGRQNYSTNDRSRAGALTLLIGSPSVGSFAAKLQSLDLANPDPSLTLLTLVGREAGGRLGIWMRTGDITGDGVADIVVGADQENSGGDIDSGSVYVIRGGSHLSQDGDFDTANLAGTPLEGQVVRLTPPASATNYHLGATCQLADLDGNGRSEVLAAATLNRAGASLGGSGTGGAPRGKVYIAWDDNFPAGAWPPELRFGNLPGAQTVLTGGARNQIFGEDMVGGLDYDGDSQADLFIGDFLADETPGRNRPGSGSGYVFYEARLLKGVDATIDSLPMIRRTTILGPSQSAIAADTAAHGDFDGDGLGDLAFGSPKDDPQGRSSAGSVQLIYGQPGGWPALIDLAPASFVSASEVRITDIHGAKGSSSGGDVGDTLCYSASSGDVDGDGITDFLVNEMLGNGVGPGTLNVGNLLILSGARLSEVHRQVMPQFGNGQGFVADFVLTNPSGNLTVTGRIDLTDDDGIPLATGFVADDGPLGAGAAQITDRIEFSIPPAGVYTIRTDGLGEVVRGAATVTSNSTVGAVQRFRVPGIGIAGVGTSPPLPAFIISARRASDGLDTGLALHNPQNAPISLELELRDQAGEPVGEVLMVDLPAKGHTAAFITEFFSGVQAPFLGTLTVRAQGGQVVALALELGSGPGQFTALPVTPRQ